MCSMFALSLWHRNVHSISLAVARMSWQPQTIFQLLMMKKKSRRKSGVLLQCWMLQRSNKSMQLCYIIIWLIGQEVVIMHWEIWCWIFHILVSRSIVFRMSPTSEKVVRPCSIDLLCVSMFSQLLFSHILCLLVEIWIEIALSSPDARKPHLACFRDFIFHLYGAI